MTSPAWCMSLVLSRDGETRWVVVDNGAMEEMEAQAEIRQAFVAGLDARNARAVREQIPGAVERSTREAPIFVAVPLAEAVELLAGNAPRAADPGALVVAVRPPNGG